MNFKFIKNSKKNRIKLCGTINKIIGIICVLVITIILILFYLSHSTCIRYNDWWIIGKNISEVEEKYGKIDKNLGSKKGYYISEDNSWIMPNHQPNYYWMVCDENGIVYDVFVAGSPGG